MKTDAEVGYFQLCLCQFWTHGYYYIVIMNADELQFD
jgi:hypothetical protein